MRHLPLALAIAVLLGACTPAGHSLPADTAADAKNTSSAPAFAFEEANIADLQARWPLTR